jgi:hypothetical protein
MKNHYNLFLTVCLAFCLFCITPAATGKVVYVSLNAMGDGSGSSWENACTSISAGIAVSATRQYENRVIDADEIWVASGRYMEAIKMKEMISLYGGFSGAETSREARDWAVNETIIDATRLNATTVRAANGAALDGFTVTGGHSSGNGGGVHCPGGSSVSLSNCTISKNYGTQCGGGVFGWDITMTSCLVAENTDGPGGWFGVWAAGLSCFGASALLDCTITGNVELGMGDTGGCVLEGRMENCTISKNRGGIGGLRIYGFNRVIENSMISDNAGSWLGGV